MKRFLLFIIILFFTINAICQKQNNTWYFGNKAGLDFSTSPPTALLDGVMSNEEAVSTISDFNGNLLFYSNGIKIWNNVHQIMDNGEGLLGTLSSSQMLIVPKPGNCKQFFIFTTPSQNDEGVLAYSLVDMTENNGLGKVILKNVILKISVTERIAATLNSNGNDYWIIAQEWGSNSFLAYSITASGVNTVPVVSNTGQIHLDFSDVIGSLKISKDGKKIVSASEIGHKKCELFDFDNATGMISNPILLSSDGAYGSEFSDDNKKLYLCNYTNFKLRQFDLSINDPLTIQNSMVVLASSNGVNDRGGALQIAPDGKIYLARYNKTFLDVINNPNLAGTSCNYFSDAINLNGRKSNAGLPNNIKDFSQSTCGLLSAKYLKTGCDKYKVVATASFGLAPYTFSIDSINFQASNVFLDLPNNTYTISAKDATGILKTYVLNILSIGSPVLKILSVQNPNCGKSDGEVTLTTSDGKAPYLYSFDAINFQVDSVFKNLNKGSKIFYVKDAEGCVVNTTILLNSIDNDKVFVGNDTIIFINETLNLIAKDISNSNFNSFVWSPVAGLNNITSQSVIARIDKDIEYTVVAKNTNTNCTTSDKITIKVIKDANIYVPTAFTPNADKLNDLLRARPLGITTFKYFNLYNRFGQLVFSTTNANVGWDGKLNGIAQNSGTYVYTTEGIDYTGRTLKKQGYVTLLR